jgi:hypothetical protein
MPQEGLEPPTLILMARNGVASFAPRRLAWIYFTTVARLLRPISSPGFPNRPGDIACHEQKSRKTVGYLIVSGVRRCCL